MLSAYMRMFSLDINAWYRSSRQIAAVRGGGAPEWSLTRGLTCGTTLPFSPFTAREASSIDFM